MRRLLNYESPFLAVKLSGESASLVLRKRYRIEQYVFYISTRFHYVTWFYYLFSYWDSSYDDELLTNPVGTRLVYNQFRDDLKRYWIHPNEHQIGPLKRLIEQDKQHDVRFYNLVISLNDDF